MKKFLTLALLFAMAFTCSAQKVASWTGVRVSYSNFKLNRDGIQEVLKQSLTQTFNGLSGTFVKSWQLSNRVPFYLETGLQLEWGTNSLDVLKELIGGGSSELTTTKTNILNLGIPLNFGYFIQIGQSGTFGIAPYVGLDGKCYVYGNMSALGSDFNIFDKDKLKDFASLRFQLGWHVGANLHISKFVVGASYGSDFTKFIKDENTKMKTWKINVGINF
ncbi:MAG: outer membrane beta-barrel protein [Muribaculaceae bacterium]|nr:outer membrane beta-barrel protein [Muribaculaceae bacterium]